MAKTLTTYGLNALKLADRNDFGVVAMPFLLHHLVDLGLMTQKEEQMGYSDNDKHITATARFEITEEGRRIFKCWFR